MVAIEPQSCDDNPADDNPADVYIADIVAAGVAAFKQATPGQVDELRRLFAPLVKAARTSRS